MQIDLRRQGPSGRRAGQAADPADRQPAPRPAFRQPHRLRRGLRHQRLPAPGPGRRRLAEQSAPARWRPPAPAARRRCSTAPEPLGARRLVGRGLRRHQRLRHRQRHQPRRRPRHRRPRRRVALRACSTKQVIPLYYDRDIDGLPRQWIKRMMNSISSLAWRFSADRMVADYVRTAYLPAPAALSCDDERRADARPAPRCYESMSTATRSRADEIDGQGHANNVAYVQWMQDAAVAHSAAQGWPGERYVELGCGWVVRSHSHRIPPAGPGRRSARRPHLGGHDAEGHVAAPLPLRPLPATKPCWPRPRPSGPSSTTPPAQPTRVPKEIAEAFPAAGRLSTVHSRPIPDTWSYA